MKLDPHRWVRVLEHVQTGEPLSALRLNAHTQANNTRDLSAHGLIVKIEGRATYRITPKGERALGKLRELIALLEELE